MIAMQAILKKRRNNLIVGYEKKLRIGNWERFVI
jgi:hypothetical protein